MIPVNDAVDSTEKDGSSFVMKDDHHRRLNKDREKQREKTPKLALYMVLSFNSRLGRGELGWGCCM
jgi:hypothetical protein